MMTTTDAYDPGLSRRYMGEANTHLANGDTASALEALRAAWSHDPFNEELPLLCATLQLNGGDAVRAAHLAVDALQVRPYYPAALDVLGVACVEALQPGLALSVLARAVAIAPELENPRVNLEAARRAKAELERAGVPKAEALKYAHLLPQNGIREVLKVHAPRLSVAILLTDGQGTGLDRRLASLAELAHEVILVDARRHRTDPDVHGTAGVTVVEVLPAIGHEAARTEAVRRASGDWILVLDADEVFTVERDVLTRALSDPTALAHLVECHAGDGSAVREPRLMRNVPGLRFVPGLDRRPMAHLMKLASQWGLTLGCDAKLATQRTGAPTAGPVEGHQLALDQAIADDPGNLGARVARARLDLASGRTDAALGALEEIVDGLRAADGDRPLVIEEPVLLLGCCLMRLERYPELATLMEAYRDSLPVSAGSQFLRGSAAKAAGRYEEAAALLTEALELRGHATFAEPLAEVRGPGLPTLLGAAMLDTGDLKQAQESFDLALRLAPDNVEASLGKIAVQVAEGEVQGVLEDLDRLIERHGANPTVWIAGGVVLGNLPEFAETAVEWMTEAQRRFPWHVEVRRRLGDALLRSGNADQALETWSSMGDDVADPASRWVAALVAGRPLPELEDDGAGVRGGVLRWFERFLGTGALDTLDRALVNLGRDRTAMPELRSETVAWLESRGQHEAARHLRGAESAS